jgi:hypothetical protein
LAGPHQKNAPVGQQREELDAGVVVVLPVGEVQAQFLVQLVRVEFRSLGQDRQGQNQSQDQGHHTFAANSPHQRLPLSLQACLKIIWPKIAPGRSIVKNKKGAN